jgi:hypothetical protein
LLHLQPRINTNAHKFKRIQRRAWAHTFFFAKNKAWRACLMGVKTGSFFYKLICVALAATQTPGNTDQVSSST